MILRFSKILEYDWGISGNENPSNLSLLGIECYFERFLLQDLYGPVNYLAVRGAGCPDSLALCLIKLKSDKKVNFDLKVKKL